MRSVPGHTTRLVRGSPIRTSSDQRSVGSSPRLLAASHVLHRLLVPRHPPCALNNLTTQQPHPDSPAPPDGDDGRTGRAYTTLSPEFKKMLASTVQFSTYDQPPAPTSTTSPRSSPPRAVRQTNRPSHRDSPPPGPCGRRGPLPQDPTACLPPNPPRTTAFPAPPRRTAPYKQR